MRKAYGPTKQQYPKKSGAAEIAPGAENPAFGRMNIDSALLREAMNLKRIWPAFQPLVDLRTGTVAGFEVLARWSDPIVGPIGPSDFIPLADAAGLIDALTHALITSACTAAMSWPGDFIMAFNISPTQLRNPGLYEFIRDAVQATGFPLTRIHIEVTESALIEDNETVLATINMMKATGIGLAIDDFGTGFAGLTRLRKFPFDTLKIDMGFVRSMDQDERCRKIMASIIHLGHSLGMTVVAEGVETELQASALGRLGCKIGQGWLFGKALNAEETQALIVERAQVEELKRRPQAPIPAVAKAENRRRTDDDRSEDNLEVRHAYLTDALANMADGIAIYDNEGYLAFINPQYSQLFPATADIRQPGFHFLDILQASIDRGEEPTPPGDLNDWKNRVFSNLQKPGARVMNFSDGRSIEARWGVSTTGNIFVNYSDLTKAKQAERQLKELNAKLAALASTDGLTGLANRRSFDERLEQECDEAARSNEPLSLFMIDVDNFKAFNDNYGHQAGDDCLKKIASRIGLLQLPSQMFAARYGGEEIAVILPKANSGLALMSGNTVKDAVTSLNIVHTASGRGIVTASIGIGTAVGAAAIHPARLVNAADKALYEAKAAGRDCIRSQVVSLRDRVRSHR